MRPSEHSRAGPAAPLTLNPSAVARSLGAVAVFLVLANLAGLFAKFGLGHDTVYGLVPLFDVDAEQNVPTLFSVILLLFASLLLAVITRFKKRERSPERSSWALLSAGFLFMAVDEAASLHEKLNKPFRAFLGTRSHGVLFFSWLVPGLALLLVLTPIFVRFLLKLPRKTRARFTAAAGLFLGGAVGMELVGGGYAAAHGQDLIYSLLATVEESLEMAGVIVFIRALLIYISEGYGEVRFRVTGGPSDHS